MPLIANPWAADAARFGQGVGQSLSAGMLQLPMQRYQIALEQARLAQQQQANQMYFQNLAQNRQGLENYRNQNIGLKQQQLGEESSYHDMENRLRAIEAESSQMRTMMQGLTGKVEGGYYIPGPLNGQPTNMGQGTTPNISQPPQQSLGQGGLPGGITRLPQQLNPQQTISDYINAQKTLQLLRTLTNAVPSDISTASNTVVGLEPLFRKAISGVAQPQGLGQTNQPFTNRVWNYNPVTGQLE